MHKPNLQEDSSSKKECLPRLGYLSHSETKGFGGDFINSDVFEQREAAQSSGTVHQKLDWHKTVFSGMAVGHVNSHMSTCNGHCTHKACTWPREPASRHAWLRSHWKLMDAGRRSVFFQSIVSRACLCSSDWPYTPAHARTGNTGVLGGLKKSARG